MTDARQFAVEFFRHWQPIINFVVPAEMVTDLEERVSSIEFWMRRVMAFDAPVVVDPSLDSYPINPVYSMPTDESCEAVLDAVRRQRQFDGSTGTPPSGQAGIKSTDGYNL